MTLGDRSGAAAAVSFVVLIFPALDVGKSGTRKEELLVPQDQLSKMWVLRRILMQMGTIDAMEFLLDKMKNSKTNEDFFATMNQ